MDIRTETLPSDDAATDACDDWCFPKADPDEPMIHRALFLSILLSGAVAPAIAAEIALPSSAVLQAEQSETAAAYELPIGAHDGDQLPTIRTEGRVSQRAWRVGGTSRSAFEVISDLKGQLVDQGYDILFECDQDSCGGFDFRYDTEVIGEPEMHVDLGDYQFLSAHMPGDTGEFVSLLVSRSRSAAFIQVTEVGPATVAQVETVTVTKSDPTPANVATDVPTGLGIGTAIETYGRFVLEDLRFETGSASLGQGEYASLGELATYLSEHPGARLALVGHTDATGSLSANINVSEARANSVLDRLVSDHGVASDRLEARGIGYLAPLASNQTEEGRQKNRRVEAVLLPAN